MEGRREEGTKEKGNDWEGKGVELYWQFHCSIHRMSYI